MKNRIICLLILLNIPLLAYSQKYPLHLKIQRNVKRIIMKNTAQINPIVKNLNFGVQSLLANGAIISPRLLNDMLGNTSCLPQAFSVQSSSLRGIDQDVWYKSLEEHFSNGNNYSSYFVETLNEIEKIYSTNLSVYQTAKEAISHLVKLSVVGKEGFPIIVVRGSEYRAKDVLLIDLSKNRFISFNKSRGYVFARYNSQMLRDLNNYDNYLVGKLIDQGVFIKESPDNAREFLATTDGVFWKRFSLNSPLGEEIWTVWNNGYGVRYFPHEHTTRFFVGSENLLFSSLKETILWQKAKNKGIDGFVVNYHPILFFPKFKCDNVFVRSTEETLEKIAGTRITSDIYSSSDALIIYDDLVALSEYVWNLDPSLRIVYKKSETKGSYRKGTIQTLVDIVDEKGQTVSMDLNVK